MYIGRFAPSPTGPLHFGSLVAALASFLDARAAGGRWLLRMEDIDPPRNSAEAANSILYALDTFGLEWDGPVLYQNTRIPAYEEALAQLVVQGRVYPCTCSRTAGGAVYDGHCRHRSMLETPDVPFALRVRVDDDEIAYDDLVRGRQVSRIGRDVGDFVVKRKEGFFAYQLAVVVDDAFQEITRVVRGNDLLDSTCRQIYLQRRFGYPTPEYAHIPLVVDARGDKLSKQTFASPLALREPGRYLRAALVALGFEAPAELDDAPAPELLAWAIGAFDIRRVRSEATIPESSIPGLPAA